MTPAPPGAASPVPDYDADGQPGLTIENSNGDESTSDPGKVQVWTYALASPLQVNGPVTLQLWSTATLFSLAKTVHPYVFLYDCAAGGAACVTIAQNDVHVDNWNGLLSSWMYREITIGSVTRSIAAGRELRVRLLFQHHDVWVAMTAAYPSALTITTG